MNFIPFKPLAFAIFIAFVVMGCKKGERSAGHYCRLVERNGPYSVFLLDKYFVDGNDSTAVFRQHQRDNLIVYCNCENKAVSCARSGDIENPNFLEVFRIFHKLNGKWGSIHPDSALRQLGPMGNQERFEMDLLQLNKWEMQLEGEWNGHTYRYEFIKGR